jgi:hypothetical protein
VNFAIIAEVGIGDLRRWGRQRGWHRLRVTPGELNAAALQFVRKISGYHPMSQANQEPFSLAIREVAAASKRLPDSLMIPRGTGVKETKANLLLRDAKNDFSL